jgi:hypothetical protein
VRKILPPPGHNDIWSTKYQTHYQSLFIVFISRTSSSLNLTHGTYIPVRVIQALSNGTEENISSSPAERCPVLLHIFIALNIYDNNEAFLCCSYITAKNFKI